MRRELLPADDLSHGFNNMADVLTVSPALPGGLCLSRRQNQPRSAWRCACGAGDGDLHDSARHFADAPCGWKRLSARGVAHRLCIPFQPTASTSSRLRSTPISRAIFSVRRRLRGSSWRSPLTVSALRWWMSIRSSKIRTIYVQLRSRSKPGSRLFPAAFINKFDGPVQDEVQPYEQSLIDVNVANMPGLTTLPHLRGLSIIGPSQVTGVSETPSRDKVFVVYPARPADESAAARTIVSSLVRRAYRKPATATDVNEVLGFYQGRRAEGESFDEGIRAALEAVLANPQFIFRFEHAAAKALPGRNYAVSDLELASRLSFFLWSSPPDDELLRVASTGTLHQRPVLEREVKRLLADKRSESLAANFAVQWLSLKNLDEVLPDPYQFPNFDKNLAQSMRRETELLFDDIARKDRSVLTLLTADYTFVDGRLAKHYGIPNVLGNRFRRVALTDENRRGLLGQASILTLTSTANRTAPVTRGKWVMQVLLGDSAATAAAEHSDPCGSRGLDHAAKRAAAHGRTSQESSMRQLPSRDRPYRLLAGELRSDGRVAQR